MEIIAKKTHFNYFIHYIDQSHVDAINTVNGRNVIEMNKMYMH